MAQPEDALAENLKEALKQAHRHLVFATSAALFLLLLAANQTASDITFFQVKADPGLARILVAVAYFGSGYLAWMAISRARRIMWRLREAAELREAVLTYPSIPTIINALVRLIALLLPVFLFLAGTIPFLDLSQKADRGLLLIIVLLSAPYFVLAYQLRYPLGKAKYKLTETSLKALEKQGVPSGTLEKLGALLNQEFPNRDRFQEALDKAAGRIEPMKHKVAIMVWASDEEVFED